MGGTSTDISLIIEGRPNLASNRRVGGHAIALGSLDIGAGSRSIARVDRGGFLNVDPASAGTAPARPVTATGATAATVTDANLVLGDLDPARFLGARCSLDRSAAEIAMDAIAGALGIDRAECCPRNPQRGQRGDGRRLRLVSVRRGVDQLVLRCSPSAMRQGCMQPRSPISSTLDGRALQRLFAEMESEAMSRLRASPGSTSGAGPG
jgi:N-methylhydantoinase A